MSNVAKISFERELGLIAGTFQNNHYLMNAEYQDVLSPEDLFREFNNRESELPFLGRGGIKIISTAEDGEKFIVRQYLRGGVVRFLSRASFLNSFNSKRPFRELKIISHLFKNHVAVPVPIFALAERKFGGLFYSGAIATLMIENADDLFLYSKICRHDDKMKQVFRKACFDAGIEASKMLKAGVYHPDLHLGNVLLDDAYKVHLIDFDKATISKDSVDSAKNRRRLVQRWDRFIEKHDLAVLESGSFREALLLSDG